MNKRYALLLVPLMASGIQQMNDLVQAIKDRNLTEVKRLIASGANVNQNIDGDKPLHFAAQFSTPEIVHQLIKARADLNAPSSFHGGSTPLLIAIGSDRPDIARVLIQAGANVNKEVYGTTALNMAESKAQQNPHFKEVVQLLISNGARKSTRRYSM